ncbi:MAG TPA: hypothetical protein VJ866_14435 [Pyrinomonadaceae bacterium]|nr:hypothetical protein [Pyrinomonadaceae bacterium]
MRFVVFFAFVWIIIIGALMIIFTENGPIVVCIACGTALTRVLGLVSIVLGAAGLYANRGALTAR